MTALNAEQVIVDSLMALMAPIETPDGWTIASGNLYSLTPPFDSLRGKIAIWLESLGEEAPEQIAPGLNSMQTERWWPFQWVLVVWNNEDTLMSETAKRVRDYGAAIDEVIDTHPRGGVDPETGVHIADVVRLPVVESPAYTSRELVYYRRDYPFRLHEVRIVPLEPF